MLQSGKAEKPCYGHIHIQGRSYVSSVWKNKYMHTILYHCFYFKQSCSMNSKKVVYSVTSICCLDELLIVEVLLDLIHIYFCDFCYPSNMYIIHNITYIFSNMESLAILNMGDNFINVTKGHQAPLQDGGKAIKAILTSSLRGDDKKWKGQLEGGVWCRNINFYKKKLPHCFFIYVFCPVRVLSKVGCQARFVSHNNSSGIIIFKLYILFFHFGDSKKNKKNCP